MAAILVQCIALWAMPQVELDLSRFSNLVDTTPICHAIRLPHVNFFEIPHYFEYLVQLLENMVLVISNMWMFHG